MFEGASLLLLRSTGARSGLERVHPLMYQQVGDEFRVQGGRADQPGLVLQPARASGREDRTGHRHGRGQGEGGRRRGA
jgi:hypothetical protein